MPCFQVTRPIPISILNYANREFLARDRFGGKKSVQVPWQARLFNGGKGMRITKKLRSGSGSNDEAEEVVIPSKALKKGKGPLFQVSNEL